MWRKGQLVKRLIRGWMSILAQTAGEEVKLATIEGGRIEKNSGPPPLLATCCGRWPERAPDIMVLAPQYHSPNDHQAPLHPN